MITKNQSLLKDLADVKFQECATMQDLYYDFATRYESSSVDSSANYFELLKAKGAKELFFKAVMARDNFEKMAEHLDDFF